MDGTRREFLASLTKWTLGSAAAVAMAGCGDVIEQAVKGAARSCPTNPDDSGGVDWFPDVAHPVFHGVTDVDTASGAPGPARIWYPTYDAGVTDAPMLKMCVARWPLVLFLHGQPPNSCSLFDYYKLFPGVTLARSGFVVVVPELQQSGFPGPGEPDSPDLDRAFRFLDWTRSGWEHSQWVAQDQAYTAVVGHSYGVPVAVQVALQRPVAALVSLSGGWAELSSGKISRLTTPSISMWSPDEVNTTSGSTKDAWPLLPTPKYEAELPGAQHFDYLADLPNCEEPRGTCPSMASLAEDLTALFIASYLRTPWAHAQVGVDLMAPRYRLTPRQQSFAGGHLATIRRLETAGIPGCSIDMSWELGAAEGSRQIG